MRIPAPFGGPVSMRAATQGRHCHLRAAERAKLFRQEDSYPHLAGEDDTRSLREDLDKAADAAGR